jgi:uncharacterized membrane protein YphA (DoxX/SURF4 family)
VLQLATGEFVRLVPRLPAWLPAQPAGAYAIGVVLVLLGVALLSGRVARTAAIPGQRFWTYFTGVALIAGGSGILVPAASRLAAALSALMIFLWVLMLHIPRALAGPKHANETAGVFEALALSGVAAGRGDTRAALR